MPELHQSELKQRSGGTFFLEDQQKNQVPSHQCSDFAKRLLITKLYSSSRHLPTQS